MDYIYNLKRLHYRLFKEMGDPFDVFYNLMVSIIPPPYSLLIYVIIITYYYLFLLI